MDSRTFTGRTGIVIATGTTEETAHGGYISGKRIVGLVDNFDGSGAVGYRLEGDDYVGPVDTEYNQFMRSEGLDEDPRVPGSDGSPAKSPPQIHVLAKDDAPGDPNDAPADKPTGGDGGVPVEMVELVSSVGDHIAAVDKNGDEVNAVVVDHSLLHRIAELIAEIRTNVGASVHHLVTELEEKGAELRAHL